MSCEPQQTSRHSLIGALAFGSIVVSCFAEFALSRRIDGTTGQIAATFLLGALYATLAVLGSRWVEDRPVGYTYAYTAVQCATVTALVFVSPLKGFFGIIVLPLISQAIFDLGWRGATAVGVYLFSLSVGLFWILFGASAAIEAVVSYTTAFAFTIVFTILTRQAVKARNVSERLAAELREANRQLREHAEQAEELATTRERNRLAREIHDGVGHYLTVIKTQLDAAAALIGPRPDEARESVLKAAKLTGDALDDVRRSVGSLRADTARPPLPEALRLLSQEAGLPVTVRLEGTARALPPGIEHALFRSAQEGLTNVRKHAAASAVELALDFRAPGRVALAVTDNGHGINGASPSTGFGLLGIRERIEVLGGRVESGNRPAGGFALTVEVPA